MENDYVASYSVDMAINCGLNAAIIDYLIGEEMKRQKKNEVAITGAEIQQKTGLSRAQQQKAIACLVEAGFLVVTLKGVPATNHFQFKLPYQEARSIIIEPAKVG